MLCSQHGFSGQQGEGQGTLVRSHDTPMHWHGSFAIYFPGVMNLTSIQPQGYDLTIRKSPHQGWSSHPYVFFETPWWYDDYTQLAYAFSTEDLPVISQANVGWLVPRQGASWQCFRHACGAEPWFHQGFAWLLMFHPPFRQIWRQEQQLPLLSVGRPGVPRLPSPVASGRRVAVAVRAVGEDGEGSGSGG